MLFKIAAKNIKKSIKDYSIYFFTLVVAVAIFYIFNSIDAQESMLQLTDSKKEMVKALVAILGYVSVFVSIILGFLIIYSNNFLIKRRKKEIAIYQILGMGKRRVSAILVMETFFIGVISLVVGLFVGVGLSQILSVFTAKLFEADMSNFKFVFSKFALIKTIVYFGIIFVLVMIFNVIALSRYKLIDLMNASKKSEKVKVRNKFVLFISFVLTIVLYVYAYHLLFNGALTQLDNTALKMIIAGAIGTFLLFFSISGVLLQLLQKCKKIYYKNLNIFVLRQINSKVNTTVVSTTIISLMLLLTIGILSGSMSLANAYNKDLAENNLADFTMSAMVNTYTMKDGKYVPLKLDDVDMNQYINSDVFKKDVDKYVSFNKYIDENFKIKNLLSQKDQDKLIKDYGEVMIFDCPANIIKESDYNALMRLYGKDEIDIKDDEYLLTANVDMVVESFKDHYTNVKTITINNHQLVPATSEIIEIGCENYNGSGNDGTVIVSDDIANELTVGTREIIGDYVKTNDVNKLDTEFLNGIDDGNIYIRTKLEMEAASVGITAIITFLGLYLGVIFAISSATVLAIGQLSEASDNQERFNSIRKIGADEKKINRALFTQISVAYLLPFVVALFNAIFGLKQVNNLIKIVGNIDLTSNIIITTVFIVVIYGGYFLSTYLVSKNIIKEK